MTDLTFSISIEETEEVKNIQPFVDFMTDKFMKWQKEREVNSNER